VTSQNTDLSSLDTLYNQLSYKVHTGKTEEIFGHKMDEEIEDWRELHTEKFVTCTAHRKFGLSSRVGWGGYVARTGGNEICIQGSGGRN
jgi:hypothetical protein